MDNNHTTLQTKVKRRYKLCEKNGKPCIVHYVVTSTIQHIYKYVEDKKVLKYAGQKVVDNSTEIIKMYPFSPISKDKVKELRKKGTYAIIVRIKGKLYALYEKPGYLNFVDNSSVIGKHKCANCERLSACCDPKGCKKVRDISKCIEDYDFIDYGLQVLNGAFIVSECKHYEEFHPPKKVTNAEYYKMKLALAQYMYPYINSLAEIPRHRYSYMYSDDYLEQFLHKSSYNTYY